MRNATTHRMVWPVTSRRYVETTREVGRKLRAGTVNLQGVPYDRSAPFGHYKQSGNGRESSKYGLEEYLEVKAIAGFNAASGL